MQQHTLRIPRMIALKIPYFLINPLVINPQSYYYNLLLTIEAHGIKEISLPQHSKATLHNSLLYVCQNQNTTIFSPHPRTFLKKSPTFLFLSSSTPTYFWLMSIKISMQIQPHHIKSNQQKHKNIASTIAHKSTHSAHYLHTNKVVWKIVTTSNTLLAFHHQLPRIFIFCFQQLTTLFDPL